MKTKLWLLLPMMTAVLLDVLCTLAGQGRTGLVEISGPNAALLNQSPFLFAAGLIGFVLAVGVIVLFIPARFAKVLALAQTICNTVGAYTWLVKLWPSEIPATLFAVALAALVLFSFQKFDKASK